jgi:hypothetical protein
MLAFKVADVSKAPDLWYSPGGFDGLYEHGSGLANGQERDEVGGKLCGYLSENGMNSEYMDSSGRTQCAAGSCVPTCD